MGMNIKPLNGCSGANAVSKSKSSTAASANKMTVNDTVKCDSINISMEGSFRAELDKEVKSIASEVASDNTDERIMSLKSDIESGKYLVSSDKLADAIMDRLFGCE